MTVLLRDLENSATESKENELQQTADPKSFQL